MFTDEHRAIVWDQLREQDSKAFTRLLRSDVCQAAAKRVGITVARSPLNAINLVWLGILGALHTAKNFAEVLGLTLKLLSDQQDFRQTPLGKLSKRRNTKQRRGKQRSTKQRRGKNKKAKGKRSRHAPCPEHVTVSEEAYVKARRRMPLAYWLAIIFVLVERFQEAHPEQLRWKGFRLLALDGTCIDLDHWRRLQAHYGSSRNARGKQKTQARMVMLQFPLTRLPYAYEVTPLKEGETTVALRLLAHVQRQDLLLIDRGFFSYGLLARIHERGAFFGIRLKKGIPLKRVRSLGYKDQLVCWRPKRVRQKGEGEELPASLQLRLIRYQIAGFRASALLTNATDPKRITREDWVRVATQSEEGRSLDPGLYHRRWEIETTFHELKVTQGMEASLRSRTPESLEYEIAGHVLLYLLVRWLMVEAALEHRQEPLRLSFSQALNEVFDMKVSLLTASPMWAARCLLPRLLERIAEHTVPLRPGRYYPRPKDGKYKDRGHGQKQAPARLKRAA